MNNKLPTFKRNFTWLKLLLLTKLHNYISNKYNGLAAKYCKQHNYQFHPDPEFACHGYIETDLPEIDFNHPTYKILNKINISILEAFPLIKAGETSNKNYYPEEVLKHSINNKLP